MSTPGGTCAIPRERTQTGVYLNELLRRCRLPAAMGSRDVLIQDICIDSRTATAGSLFLATPGNKQDGAAFVNDAIGRGAVAVVADRPINLPDDLPLIQVPSVRAVVSPMAAEFFGLKVLQEKAGFGVIGITGTNGKSTTAYMIREMLTQAGKATALFGTIEYDLLSRKLSSSLTTPDPVSLVKYLVESHHAGAKYAAMEVSSHSLDQHRVDGIRFSVGVFTNLTQDHLDYHKTMDAYLAAKRRLFDSLDDEATAVVNADDAASNELIANVSGDVIRYGLSLTADLRAENISQSRTGTIFELAYRGKRFRARTELVGKHNVYNALSACATGFALGFDADTVIKGVESLKNVPGRLQRMDSSDRGFDVFVDYAHTDDALRNVLTALRPLTTGKLVCVFGCGGDRDRTKRPKMARAVAELADSFVITSDNPRTEDPLAIIKEIKTGLSGGDLARGVIEPDRAQAISLAIGALKRGDVLLIAGKGHENYQIIGTTSNHFDDVEVAQAAITRR